MNVATNTSVPPYGPDLPSDPVFNKDNLREFLLGKSALFDIFFMNFDIFYDL